MARKSRKANTVTLDMTPMIDVVMQLIIFFILTMQIAQKDQRSVALPTALTSLEAPRKEEIYVLHLFNDKAKDNDSIPPIDGWHITRPRSTDKYTTPAQLAPKLRDVSQQAPFGEFNDKGNSEMEVLVRGDMRCPSHFFAVVLKACTDARVYKVKVSVKPFTPGQ